MGIDNKTATVFCCAALLRVIIFVLFPAVPDFLTSQVEISTPLSSWKRLQEGLFLYQRGISPYDGGVYHQAPLLLVITEFVPAQLLFTALDLFNAAALYSIADRLKIPSPRFKQLDGTLIAAAYLFNPFTILSCLGRSTNIFTNTAIVQAVFNALTGNASRSMLALAIGTYLSMYPALLLPPLLLLARESGDQTAQKISVPVSILSFLAGVAALISSTPLLTGSIKDVLVSCYGAQITVPDLTPNAGLWWYFFTEIFDPFRNFFIGVFWLHLVSYVGGLTFRLHNQPLFVVISLLGLIAIFKPYPSISDVSLYLGFLPLYKHILPRMFQPPHRSASLRKIQLRNTASYLQPFCYTRRSWVPHSIIYGSMQVPEMPTSSTRSP